MTPIAAAFTRPLTAQNPIAVQLLGICSALAVTKSVDTALVMTGALAVVVVASSALISAIRHALPQATRLVIEITIIATFVIVVDQILATFAPVMSRRLSIFVSLIITNCIVLGRAEGFATSHGVGESVADALGNAAGYGLLLVAIGAVREFFGAGSLLGFQLLPLASEGGWFEPLRIFGLPPAGFFLVAGAIWVLHGVSRPRQERREPRGATSARGEET